MESEACRDLEVTELSARGGLRRQVTSPTPPDRGPDVFDTDSAEWYLPPHQPAEPTKERGTDDPATRNGTNHGQSSPGHR